jgi:hypothetical protein
MMAHGWRNTLDGAIIVVAAWLCLFGWSVVKTIYDDHQGLVGTNSQLVSECRKKDTTISELQEKLRIKESEAQTAALSYLFAFEIRNSQETPLPPLEADFRISIFEFCFSPPTIVN